MSFVASHFAPLMFAGLVVFLLIGFPVAFSLAACGLCFGALGIELGLLPSALMQAVPLRIFGIMKNDTLLAIPFFTLMGLVLERSGMAEDLLETIGQLFGPVRGGLALAVVFVGALLAATTGVVAASVISMGLISLPIMLRYGYDRRVASGVIAASGTLAQIIPPSLVLIVLADQLGRSVGDMYKAAFLPGVMLTGFYALYILGLAVFRPAWVPALPPEARGMRESEGRSGLRSLLVLLVLSVGAAVAFDRFETPLLAALGRTSTTPLAPDEAVVAALCVGTGVAFALALLNRATGLGALSRLAERVTFVLMPPLALVFLVLGTIFLGVATPTEGGALGALGAMALAVARGRLNLDLLTQALTRTARLSCFVVFILIGSTIFSLTFQGADGPLWVEGLLTGLPGGAVGFLIAVNALIFVLAFFLDFFELSFIVVPLLAPVADKLGIDLLWFGVLLGVNMQTSFMHPPFGFALFFLRSVAPGEDYDDRVSGRRIARVTTGQIYRGAIPFVLIQLTMVGLLIAFPHLAGGGAKPTDTPDATTIRLEAPPPLEGTEDEAASATAAAQAASAAELVEPKPIDEKAAKDPVKAIEEMMSKDKTPY